MSEQVPVQRFVGAPLGGEHITTDRTEAPLELAHLVEQLRGNRSSAARFKRMAAGDPQPEYAALHAARHSA